MEPIAPSGSLDQTQVAHLLVQLHQQNATGSLKLERAPLQKAVYLKDGQILFAASNDPKDQLASILVEEGKLGPDQMAIAQARVSAGNPLAKILTDLGYVSQRELADAAKLKVEKILADLYSWKDGSYQFAEGSLPKGAIDLELSTVRLLFNSIRRIQDRDWVLKQLGSLDAVLAATPSLTPFLTAADPEPRAGDVLRALDGTRSVKQIASSATLAEFEVCKILAAAVLLGAAEVGSRMVPTEMLRVPSEPAPDLTALFEASAAAEEQEEPSAPRGGWSTPANAEEPRTALAPPPRAPSGPPGRISDFIIDEAPSPAARGPAGRTTKPARRSSRGGGGGSNLRAILTLVAVTVLGAGALYYVYVYLPGKRTTNDTTAQVTTSVDVTTTIDSERSASSTPSTSVPRVTTSATVTTTSTPVPKPSTAPSTSTSTPLVRATSTVPRQSGAGATGARETLQNGDFAAAAEQFLVDLRTKGQDKYSIAVGLNCDIENVASAVKNAGSSSDLFILPARYNNKACYRLCWGLYDSADAAESAIQSLPSYFKRQKPVPIAAARLIR